MRTVRRAALVLAIALSAFAAGCVTEPGYSNNIGSPSPAASPSLSPSTAATTKEVPVTLAVLDALFSDEAFKTKLKTKLELTNDQLTQLQKIASAEVARLRQSNVEAQSAAGLTQAAESRERAVAA